jgi:hypothetical protein
VCVRIRIHGMCVYVIQMHYVCLSVMKCDCKIQQRKLSQALHIISCFNLILKKECTKTENHVMEGKIISLFEDSSKVK